jgi:hypothetical protein
MALTLEKFLMEHKNFDISKTSQWRYGLLPDLPGDEEENYKIYKRIMDWYDEDDYGGLRAALLVVVRKEATSLPISTAPLEQGVHNETI